MQIQSREIPLGCLCLCSFRANVRFQKKCRQQCRFVSSCMAAYYLYTYAPIDICRCHESELWKSKAGVLVCKDRVGLRIDLATGQNRYIKGKDPSPPMTPPPLD